jgi:phosphotransferase system  glucose/maltose/N-acetylglucosamine-specific IIC component
MHNTPPTFLKRLVTSSVLYIVIALLAASMAIKENLSAQPMGEGSGSGKPILQDFLYGSGTAMSPGLPWLIAQALLTVLVFRKSWWGMFGVVGLIIFGLLSGVFSLTEPIVREIYSSAMFDPLKAVIEAGIIILPFVMVVFGILEWRRRRRD